MAAELLIDTVVVALNAAATLPALLRNLPQRQLRSIVVVDRGSDDDTAQIARDFGALVLREPRGGVGAAYARAQRHFAQLPNTPDIVAMLPASCAQAATGLAALWQPLVSRGVELALAIPPGRHEKQSFSHWMLRKAIDTVYRERLAGIYPVRAIRFAAWVALGMSDRSETYEIELVVRAMRLGLTYEEVAISGVEQTSAASPRALLHMLRHATIR